MAKLPVGDDARADLVNYGPDSRKSIEKGEEGRVAKDHEGRLSIQKDEEHRSPRDMNE